MKNYETFRKFIIEQNIEEHISNVLKDSIKVLKGQNVTYENFAALLTTTNLIVTLDILESYHEWLNS